MVRSELKWTKRARLATVVLCMVLGTAGLLILSQMDQVAEAAILTPIESPPETIFYEDFSGGLGQWTIMGGTWGIENRELNGSGYSWANIVAGDMSWTNYVVQAKVKPLSRYEGTADTNHAPGILTRYNDEGNFLMLYLHQDGTKITLGAKVAGVWKAIHEASFTWSNGNWYTLKLEVTGLTAKAYVDGQYLFTASVPSEILNGKIGVEAYDSHAHFDDVNVSVVLTADAYNLKVRAGATQIVMTCTWQGTGNMTIANLTSPATVYYESNMSVYERTTVSSGELGTSTFNVKRALISIPASSTSETWILNLDLDGVTTYQVSAEIN